MEGDRVVLVEWRDQGRGGVGVTVPNRIIRGQLVRSTLTNKSRSINCYHVMLCILLLLLSRLVISTYIMCVCACGLGTLDLPLRSRTAKPN